MHPWCRAEQLQPLPFLAFSETSADCHHPGSYLPRALKMLKILLLKKAGSQLCSSSYHLAFFPLFMVQIFTGLEQIAISASLPFTCQCTLIWLLSPHLHPAHIKVTNHFFLFFLNPIDTPHLGLPLWFMEKAMETDSSTLAWKIPWTEQPGCSPWGCEESDTTEWLHFHFSLSCIGEGNGNPSSVLAWRIPWTEEPGRLQSMGSLRVRHDWATFLSLFTFMHWRRKWQPTPVFLPGESQGRRGLVGCHLWGRTELDTTEAI